MTIYRVFLPTEDDKNAVKTDIKPTVNPNDEDSLEAKQKLVSYY